MLRIQLVGSKFLPEYAGAALRIHHSYRRLRKLDDSLSLRVIAGSTEFAGPSSYVHDGIAVERIASRLTPHWRRSHPLLGKVLHALRSWGEAMQVWLRLRRQDFDILHVFGSSSVTAAAIAWAAAKRVPLVIELVTTEAAPWQTLPALRIGGWLRHRLRKRSLIVAISAALAERCAKQGLTTNVWSRPNPIDSTRFFPAFEQRAALRAQHTPFAASDFLLCMVAKFMPQKNQIFLIDVLVKLPDRFKLILAGPVVAQGPLSDRDQAYVAAIRRRIANFGLERRVLLITEFVPADAYIKLADVYMLPNRDEGLATPMLESLACGVPVVANASEAAFQQWIEPGRSGYLCPLDPDAWAEAIEGTAHFPTDRLLAAARLVAESASAGQIDRQFLRLIQALAVLPRDGELDVAALLRPPS